MMPETNQPPPTPMSIADQKMSQMKGTCDLELEYECLRPSKTQENARHFSGNESKYFWMALW
jgi:hypothetical protein